MIGRIKLRKEIAPVPDWLADNRTGQSSQERLFLKELDPNIWNA